MLLFQFKNIFLIFLEITPITQSPYINKKLPYPRCLFLTQYLSARATWLYSTLPAPTTTETADQKLLLIVFIIQCLPLWVCPVTCSAWACRVLWRHLDVGSWQQRRNREGESCRCWWCRQTRQTRLIFLPGGQVWTNGRPRESYYKLKQKFEISTTDEKSL